MTTTYRPLTDSIPAADLTPGMTLDRVAQVPLSAVFSDPIAAKVLEVQPFTQHGVDYVKVVLETTEGTFRALNLQTDRPVRAA